MKKIKNIIIIVIILIIATLISIIILNMTQKNKTEIDKVGDIGDEPEITGEQELVTDTTKIATIEDCVEKYYNAINNNSSSYYIRGEDGYEKSLTNEEINQNIINILSDEYITQNNINMSNLDNYIKKINEDVNVISLKMKVLVNDPIEKYVVCGKIVNMNYNMIDEFYIYVNLDTQNKTFSIEPIDVKDFEKIEIVNNNNSIEIKDNNTYEEADLGYEEIIKEGMRRFKILAFSDVESSYNYLDKEYKQKRFGDINKYKEYIELNRENLEAAEITKYKVNYYEDSIEYICIDQNGNYYIFNETSLMEFTIKLDSYTIDIPEFIEKYDGGNDQTKVAMNIEKVIQALNNKDYNYIYGKLDETFKRNNFETINKFEEYMKNNFFEKNQIYSGVYSKKGDIYTYELKVKEIDEEIDEIIDEITIDEGIDEETDEITNQEIDEETDEEIIEETDEEDMNLKDVTIIMKLLEDRNFVMSFSIN